MKKKKENYLEKIPCKKETISWSVDDDKKVTLEIENKGVFNKIAQKLLKKPKISYVHLEEFGSFIWPLIDGEKNVQKIGELVKEEFGEKAEPLFERVSQYFGTLEAYGFVEFKK